MMRSTSFFSWAMDSRESTSRASVVMPLDLRSAIFSFVRAVARTWRPLEVCQYGIDLVGKEGGVDLWTEIL